MWNLGNGLIFVVVYLEIIITIILKEVSMLTKIFSLALICGLVLAVAPASAAPHEYIGAAKCKMCHNKSATGEQYKKWADSPHAISPFFVLFACCRLIVAHLAFCSSDVFMRCSTGRSYGQNKATN